MKYTYKELYEVRSTLILFGFFFQQNFRFRTKNDKFLLKIGPKIMFCSSERTLRYGISLVWKKISRFFLVPPLQQEAYIGFAPSFTPIHSDGKFILSSQYPFSKHQLLKFSRTFFGGKMALDKSKIFSISFFLIHHPVAGKKSSKSTFKIFVFHFSP